MFTIEEIWEEQERQYNQLMEEDDQYCHPESFRWGFEHGVEYALTKVGWRPASELPNMGEEVVTWVNHEDGTITVSRGIYVGWPKEIINKLRWCYPPKEE